MNVLSLVRRLVAVLGILMLCLACAACNGGGGSDGLEPGINYMQPLKWRMTYKYRVQEVFPISRFQKKQESKFFPGIPVVGKGSYEVWFALPREGEEVRNVQVIQTAPEATKVAQGKGKDSDLSFVYYDFTPDGFLPREINASVTVEFVTFERYTYWEEMPPVAYDTSSEIYKRFTKEEKPILFHDVLKREVDSMVKDIPAEDVKARAVLCYNHLLKNFTYDHDQEDDIKYVGFTAVTDSRRAWENRSGTSDEVSNLFVAMLRGIGIPARSCSGSVHDLNGDAPLYAGSHTWSEIYLQDVGWVPVDAAWGAEGRAVPKLLSPMAERRQLSYPDYYYGKSDPYRITFSKDWNLTLQPPPKTKGAKPSEITFQYHTSRRSGVNSVTSGYEPEKGLADAGTGWVKSEAIKEKNMIMELELLGPPTQAELDELIKEIEAEGGHYKKVPYATGLSFPIKTTQ